MRSNLPDPAARRAASHTAQRSTVQHRKIRVEGTEGGVGRRDVGHGEEQLFPGRVGGLGA